VVINDKVYGHMTPEMINSAIDKIENSDKEEVEG
jgi:NADH:ubiquinone oxidoreductase subunit E